MGVTLPIERRRGLQGAAVMRFFGWKIVSIDIAADHTAIMGDEAFA